MLDARSAVSTAERAAEFARMRRLSGCVAHLWIERRADLGHPHGATPAAEPARPVPHGATSTADGPRRSVFEIGTEEMPPADARLLKEAATPTVRSTRTAWAATRRRSLRQGSACLV